MKNEHLAISPEVAEALDAGAPVVALESTIIAHGFGYPANRECALRSEEIAREADAVPATIAVLDGKLTVGLSAEEIEYLATNPDVPKASRRDIPVLVARGGDGATTVSATMLIAALAGIRVFATGGIGGVHRGASETFDISADLQELARTDVLVVSAGAKSVLDLGLTLEYLETYGVPVLGFRTEEFPAFYEPSSGFGVDTRVDSADEAAAIVAAKWELGLGGGAVLANPIAPEHALDQALLERAMRTALQEAEAADIHGKDVTPFLLARIHEITDGASEEANKQLVWSNVRLAAEVAGALARRSS
ncbi:MAG: pseudouridine-5'-phosphate glycosidase [Coriobacteriia bacterium]